MFYTAEMTAWLVGGVIECVLLLYLLWSLFGDRSKGRKRCPSCAHPFGDLSGTRCPECGNDAQEERNLYATRRHWARAFTAIVLMFSIAVVIRMRAVEFNATRCRLQAWHRPAVALASDSIPVVALASDGVQGKS